MTISNDYKTVSAGFALGLVMNGQGRIGAADTGTLDRAFWSAWCRWPAAQNFSRISEDAEARSRCLPASRFIYDYGPRARSVGSPLRWHDHGIGWLEGAYDPNDHEEYASLIHEGVSAKSWEALVQDVLATEREHRSED